MSLEKRRVVRGPSRVSPFFFPMTLPNMAAGQVAIHVGARGPNSCVTTACAAANHAIGDAFKIIQRDDADIMLAGGTEALITPIAIAAFGNMKALSTRNNEPKRASRPFDRDRDGFVMGEGAGMLLLEERDQAKQRGARIYAEIVGYGMTSDAFHMTMPDPDAQGVARCIKMALADASVRPEEVEYINAHGTSTPYNDTHETLAIKQVFGEHAYHLAVSSTKLMTGHLLGAAGGIEAIFTALAIYHGIVPPTVNHKQPDAECDLDYVPHYARYHKVTVALSNSFGFGGYQRCPGVQRVRSRQAPATLGKRVTGKESYERSSSDNHYPPQASLSGRAGFCVVPATRHVRSWERWP